MRAIRLVAAICLLPIYASAYAAQDLVIDRWLVAGPFASGQAEDRLSRDLLGGAAAALPTLGDEGWREVTAGPSGRVDLNEVFAGKGTAWSAAYAHVYVFAPEDRTVLLVADSDDDLVVRLNGQRVWRNEVARGLGGGSDTVTVRLATGWNGLMLQALNRTGGFGLLGRLTPADGLLLSAARPPGMVEHHHPEPTVTVGPLLLGPLTWYGDELSVATRSHVTAWGPTAFSDVSVRIDQDERELGADSHARVSPGEPVELRHSLGFSDLRSAAIGSRPILATVSWPGGSHRSEVRVDAGRLLRLADGRIPLLTLFSGQTKLYSAVLVVPPLFDGLSLDLLAPGLGPESRYRVNRRDVDWQVGRVELCAPCSTGDSLKIEIAAPPGRELVEGLLARVREMGYAEYADGYGYAEALAGRAPPIAPPDPVSWLKARVERGDSYERILQRYRDAYAPLSAEIRRDTLHLIGNSHIDAAWLWPWSETIGVIRDTWRTSLHLAEMFPGYIFSGSAAAYYDAMDRLEPGLADSLAAAVAARRWVPVGGWWVESDLNLPGGESLVRQGLYGQRYFERRFGARSRVGWTPDCFGYPRTIPQILRGVGLDYFVTQKIRWNDSTEFPYNAFYWQGLDGTRILTYNPYGYVHDLAPQKLIDERIEDRERHGLNHQIVLYGVGDHGGGPTIAMLRRAEDLRRVPTFPVMMYDTPLQALQAVEGAGEAQPLPVWDDELYLEYHRGTYTTQARTKWRNRRSEVMLQAAEALAAVARPPYPRQSLESAWRLVLFNQFHDILPGSGIEAIYEDAEIFYDSAWAIIDSVTQTAFADLRSRMDTRVGDRPLVVFNSLGWPRSGRVTVNDEAGRAIRVAVDEIPAYGARVVRVPRDTLPSNLRRLAEPRAGESWLENAYLRVELDPLTGEIVRLYDKANAREVLAPGGRGNVLQIFDDRPDQWDAWNLVTSGERWEIANVSSMVSETDPWQAELSIERRWGASTFRQTLVLRREARYLDVLNEVGWHERRKALKVAFALDVEADSATYEIPYGTIGRSGRPRTQAERAKFEVAGQRWADVSQADYGVSILNDSKYGWDYRDNVLRLTLLKSPIWPDSTADRGTHRFSFAVLPHAGDWREAGTLRRAAEYNASLIAAFEPEHDGELGKQFSFADVEPANVELSWLKRAEDSDAWVLRLVEWHGAAVEARVRVACRIRAARRANLLEDPGDPLAVRGREVRVSLRAYEIATLLVECE